MFKKLTILFGALLLSLAAYAAVTIFEGEWSDGTKVEWACPKGAAGVVPFQFTTIEGKEYRGVLRCGVAI